MNGHDVRYNVYASRTYPVDITQARNLIRTAMRDTVFEFNPMYVGLYGYHFAVTATDRSGNESVAATPKELLEQQERAALRPHGQVSMDEDGITLRLPESKAEFFIILDMQGRLLRTEPYRQQYRTDGLTKGVYQVRTLESEGYSRPLGEFIK